MDLRSQYFGAKKFRRISAVRWKIAIPDLTTVHKYSLIEILASVSLFPYCPAPLNTANVNQNVSIFLRRSSRGVRW